MNPERNKDRVNVNALLLRGLFGSTVIPLVAFIILDLALPSLNRPLWPLFVAACAVAVLLSVSIINYFIQRLIRDRIQQLADVCRDYASGDRAVRAAVFGDDDFAKLSLSVNALMDNQSGGGSSAV